MYCAYHKPVHIFEKLAKVYEERNYFNGKIDRL